MVVDFTKHSIWSKNVPSTNELPRIFSKQNDVLSFLTNVYNHICKQTNKQSSVFTVWAYAKIPFHWFQELRMTRSVERNNRTDFYTPRSFCLSTTYFRFLRDRISGQYRQNREWTHGPKSNQVVHSWAPLKNWIQF